MHPRHASLAVIAACLALSLMLAGCLSTDPATAQEVRSAAEREALAWDAGAELIMIVGVEGTMNLPATLAAFGGDDDWNAGPVREIMQAEEWELIQKDRNPGDGRAELWVFVYRAGEGPAHLGLLVDKGGDVLRRVEEQVPVEGTLLGRFSIDSAEAMGIARTENADLERGLSGEEMGVVMVLLREEPDENPNWLIAGGGGTMVFSRNGSGMQGGGGMVLIDAVTGAVVESEGGGSF